jgi:Cytochrome oxidase complex assembly protein 1
MNALARLSPSWLHRNWKWFLPITFFLLFLIAIGFAAAIIFTFNSALKSSEPYTMALMSVKTNPRVIDALGEPIVDSFWFSGNIKLSGSSGNAKFTIPISGPKAKASIDFVAKKSGGKWQFSRLTVELNDTDKQINLLRNEEALHE